MSDLIDNEACHDEYWAACAGGRFALQQCASCGHWRFPPSPLCPRCHSPRSEWRDVSGSGTLWSWIRVHQRYFAEGRFELPYLVAFVELDEGPRMVSTIVGLDGDPVVGSRLQAELRPDAHGERIAPVFRVVETPVEPEGARQ